MFFVYVQVFMCIQIHVSGACTHRGGCTYGAGEQLWVSLLSISTIVLRQGFSLVVDQPSGLARVSSKLQGFSFSGSGITSHTPLHFIFLYGLWEFCSGPQVFKAFTNRVILSAKLKMVEICVLAIGVYSFSAIFVKNNNGIFFLQIGQTTLKFIRSHIKPQQSQQSCEGRSKLVIPYHLISKHTSKLQ